MQIKYRVHEVAKDLNVDKKEIIDLLDRYFSGEQHKHATALTEEELNVVFEHYTQNNPGRGACSRPQGNAQRGAKAQGGGSQGEA